MNNLYAINTVWLVISSAGHLLEQIQTGKEDKKNLKRQIDLLIRLLCSVFVAHFDSQDDAIDILAEYCLTSVFPKLRGYRLESSLYSLTTAIKATPRHRADGNLGLAATKISAEHILSMYRHRRPEKILA